MIHCITLALYINFGFQTQARVEVQKYINMCKSISNTHKIRLCCMCETYADTLAINENMNSTIWHNNDIIGHTQTLIVVES